MITALSPPSPRTPAWVEGLRARDPLSCPILARSLVERYLIFDAFVGGQRRVDLHPLLLTPAAHAQAVAAAEAAGRVIAATADRAHADPEEAARYRLPDDALRLCRASRAAGDDATLSRVDLLLGEDGFRACEINADCPGGHNEALGLPALAQAAGFYGGLDPTTVVPRLCDALISLRRGEGAVALVFATAYAEDLQVCALLQRELSRRGVPALLTPPTALTRRHGKLTHRGQRVSVLYRYFPTEYMEGQRNLGAIEAAVTDGSVRTLANFGELFAQSKLAFARAHALADTLPYDVRADLAVLPKTVAIDEVSEADLQKGRARLVVKRALGRVGEEVFVGALGTDEEWDRVIRAARAEHLDGQEVWIVQDFVRQRPVPTPYGPRLLTLGVYLLQGRFAGYFARLTPQSHASHDALCLPVFVAPTAEASA